MKSGLTSYWRTLFLFALTASALRAVPIEVGAAARDWATDEQILVEPHREFSRDPFGHFPQDVSPFSVIPASLVPASAAQNGTSSPSNVVVASNHVPDGGATMILLGCSLLVVFLFGRRLAH